MPTRNVVLTSRQAEFVERLVSTGRYQNASEVLRAGIRLIEREEAEDEARLTALREAARIGIADIDAGRFAAFDSPDTLRRHLATVAGRAIAGGTDPAR
ncbi:MAG: type II toxin-antitoxin system ParD family antitoxin [Acidobacteriota bacterium]|nr:type II toxin-antitoxin system ParD family antitoxin [Acidobacteriota bacterium]